MILMLKPDSASTVLVPGLLLFGLGMGLVFSQINNLTLSAVEPHLAGEASGVNNTMRQVGSSFGAAIIGAALFASIASQIQIKIQDDPTIPDAARAAITEQAKTAAKDGGFEGSDKPSPELPAEFRAQLAQLPAPAQAAAIDSYKKKQEEIGNAVKADVNHGITEAVKDTLMVTLAFSILSVLIAFTLPKIGSLSHEGEKKPSVGH